MHIPLPRSLPALFALVILLGGSASAPAPARSQASPPNPPTQGAPEPLLLRSKAFGAPVEVEVRDLPEAAAREALVEALRSLRETETLLTEAEERLNDDPRTERAVELPPAPLELLRRVQSFCEWSGGAVGPLGGSVLDHWRAVAGNPSPPPVPAALAESAACARLSLSPEGDPEGGTARVAAGSRVDLSPFAAGFAIDRAVDALRAAGAGNGRVRVGRIERGFGIGPHGTDPRADRLPPGWPVTLPALWGERRTPERFRLDDRSLAIVWREDWPGDRPLLVDLRTGAAPEGVWATAAVSERALDAQALAVAALVLGSREGRYRMSGLAPAPSVLWLMGSGRGRPLRSDLNWSDLASR